MHIALLLAIAAVAASADGAEKNAAGQKNADQHARVLLVTGVDYPGHPWRETAPAVRKILEKDPRMEVRMVEDPDFLAAPAVFDYNVIVLHFKNYKPLPHAAQACENLTSFVKQGKGLVLTHFACGAFEDWPGFADLAGRVWDTKKGHDPRGPFPVKIADRRHPITREMKDFQADDELYWCIKGDRPVEVLATARSKVTGRDEPIALAFEHGKGRVFQSLLGHDVRAIEMPGAAELIHRGCLWAARIEPPAPANR